MVDSSLKYDDSLVDYNDVLVDPDDLIAGKPQGTLNKGDETYSDPLDWTFGDEHEALSKSGDSSFYDPYHPKSPRGSIEDIQHKLKVTGLRLRKDLNRSLLTKPQHWTALRRPASLHSAQRTLAEMLVSLPTEEQGHFH